MDEDIAEINLSTVSQSDKSTKDNAMSAVAQDEKELELSKIKLIFYPTEPNLILEDLGTKGNAILVRANVIRTDKKKSSKNSRRETRFSILQHLAEIASQGLICLFATKGNSFAQYLLLYHSRDEAESSLLLLNEKDISTKYGPVQLYSEFVTETHDVRCVAPFVADCFQFMLKRLQILNLTGSPISKQSLRSIYNQRKRHVYTRQKATLTALPASSTTGQLESEDDDSISDSTMSSSSILSNRSFYHQSPDTKHLSIEPEKVISDEAMDIRRSGSFDENVSPDCLPLQTTMSQLDSKERTLQSRYWGLSNDTDKARCTSCALEGHVSWNCPSQKCDKCHAFQQHSSDACPAYQVCTKCRERGHQKEQCPSKLSMTSADGFVCHRCNQNGHVEEVCSSLWRSYIPFESRDITKVDRLLISCYQCGLNGHWGDDCKVIPKRKTLSNTNDVFSAKSANTYLSTPMDLHGHPPSSTKPSHGAGFRNEEDDGSSFYKIKGAQQATRGAIKIRTTRDFSRRTNSNNLKINQPVIANERPNFSSKRQRSHPPSPSNAYSNQLTYTQNLPVDTYWRSGGTWQPPLPKEQPPPSTQNFDIKRSFSGGHKLPNKPSLAQRQRGYSYARSNQNK